MTACSGSQPPPPARSRLGQKAEPSLPHTPAPSVTFPYPNLPGGPRSETGVCLGGKPGGFRRHAHPRPCVSMPLTRGQPATVSAVKETAKTSEREREEEVTAGAEAFMRRVLGFYRTASWLSTGGFAPVTSITPTATDHKSSFIAEIFPRSVHGQYSEPSMYFQSKKGWLVETERERGARSLSSLRRWFRRRWGLGK